MVGVILFSKGLGISGQAAAQTTILTNPSQFSGSETVVTFETFPASPLVPISNQLLKEGVLISVDAGSLPQQTTDSNATFPRQFGPTGPRALLNIGGNNVLLTFNQDITRIGFEIRTNTADDLNLTIQCMCGGSPVHTQFFVTNLIYKFVGLESTTPFDQVVIDVTNNVNGAMRVDNLRFEGPPKCDVSSAVYESALYDTCPPDPQFPTLELCQGGASLSGPPNGPTQYIGSRFHVRETFLVSTLGGQIQGPRPQLGVGDQHIFAVIVALSDPAAFPVGGGAGFPFSPTEIVGSTRFHPGLGGNDVRTPLSATLTPGDYALIFGAGDVPGFTAFDTTGDASLPVSSLASVSAIIQWDGFSWIDNFYGPGFGPRFVVEGSTLFHEAEGASSTVWLDAGRSRDIENFPVNIQWTTDCPGASIDNPTSASTTLLLDTTTACPNGVTCGATLEVDDGNDSSAANPSSICTWTVSIDDTTKPTVTCPADATGVECPADTGVATRGTATASDLYGVASVSSSDVSVPDCGTTVNITRTWSVDDNCGNTASCDQTISTIDTVGPTITVNTAPVTVTDTDCSGSEVVVVPTGSAHDACDGLRPLSHNAPATFPAGQTLVTYSADDECGNASQATLNVKILFGANIEVSANRHEVGAGSHPGSTKSPLVGILVGAYDKSAGSCARQQDQQGDGISWQEYAAIVANCTPVSTAVTNASGTALINLPPGDYVVITHFDSDGDSTLDQYLGVSASDLACGQLMKKHLQLLVDANGNKKPGKTTRLTGSELLIIEPEYVIWDNTQQLYPFVFESIGDWGVTATVAPPEGFVADYSSLSENVDNTLAAVQFTITEVGSELIPTETAFRVHHKGRIRDVRSSVGILLTPEYARSRGFDVSELREKGLIVEPKAQPSRKLDRTSPR